MLNNKGKINVFVVDDSAFMRKVITDILNSDEQINVIGTASNGKIALLKLKTLSPDIITLDVEMPYLNGLEVLKSIMLKKPLPVIMLSSLTKEGAETTIKALELGALDFIEKPSSLIGFSLNDFKKRLINKVKLLYKVKPIKYSFKANVVKINNNCFDKLKNIVTIGTSTGGPSALKEVLKVIPKNLPASFLVVQHMPQGFTRSLAERLNMISELQVKEAEDGDILRPGTAFIAPGNFHMVINQINRKYFISLNQDKEVSGHRPSVDVLIESIKKITGLKLISVILTGMGSDGAKAIKKVKEERQLTVITQDEDTSVVYGMPKAVNNMGITDVVLPLSKIGHEIVKIVNQG